MRREEALRIRGCDGMKRGVEDERRH